MAAHGFARRRVASSAIAIAAAALGAATAGAEEFRVNRFFVIGDSLSDAGTYSQGVPVVSGLPAGPRYRFTTNALDGSSLVWSEHVARALGINQAPDVLQGVPVAGLPTIDLNGGNYAEGGARVADQPGVIGALTPALGFTTLPGVTQIDRLLADNPTLSGSDLVAVWLGANDVFTQYGAIGFGLPVAAAGANLQTAADQLVAQVDRLVAAGAKNIIVVTVPNIGTTPFGLAQPDGGATLSSLSSTFNDRLVAGLAGRPAVIVDSGKLLSAVQADPVRYGFTAVNAATVPACTGDSLTCVRGINASADSELRIFADGVHPTAAAHTLFGQAGFAGLQAASQTGTMAVAILSALRQQSIGLENRLTPVAYSETGADGKPRRRTVGSWEKFGSIEGGYYSADAEQVRPGLSATTEVIKAGGDVMIAPNALVGLGVSLDHGQLDFDGDRGGFDSRLFIGVAYGSLALSQNFYLNAAAAAGYIDVYDIERSFLLGAGDLFG
jgi:outer membrane lipase/esterase